MNEKVAIQTLDYHVTNACNLSCESCSHYSNFHVQANAVSPDQAYAEMRPWSEKLAPELLSILGGEPTLHPQLCEILEAVSPLFDCTRRLTTNGFFLHRHPRLPEVLKKHKIQLRISLHHRGERYQAQERKIRQLVYPWLMDGVEVKFFESDSLWIRFYKPTETGIKPIGGDSRRSWNLCRCKTCHPVYKQHLWKCPPLAYFQDLEAKLGNQGAEWELFRQYKPLPACCTIDELRAFLKENEPQCSLCPDQVHLFQLQDPIGKSGKSVP